ncbi:tyrosine-type recombinase/integrase [Streptomyces sp. NPDC059651]|uniref:tyrosine-type recombinase/integrase n=1 Tax=Streptomyces sp. NPDC059651 TaxID=3346897 RepID=UPI0036B29066
MTHLELASRQPDPRRREVRDRLELLTALISGPDCDPVFSKEIITIPADHPVYPWFCSVLACERPRHSRADLCPEHGKQWRVAREEGADRGNFVRTAEPLQPRPATIASVVCRICRTRPAFNRELALCQRHRNQWVRSANGTAFERWLDSQSPYVSYGQCKVTVCDEFAESALGLCTVHADRYRRAGSPGQARLPAGSFVSYEKAGRDVPVEYADQAVFLRWCATAQALRQSGQVNLRGLRPLARAEFQWSLHAHEYVRGRWWNLAWIQDLVDLCREQAVNSLLEADVTGVRADHRAVVHEMETHLRLLYVTPAETKKAGFIETEHFGHRFPTRSSRFDLTRITQRWLRDLAWEYLADRMRSPQCPRTGFFLDHATRACAELSTFLELVATGGGHDPAQLQADQMQQFVADVRRRESKGLPSLARRGAHDRPVIMSASARREVFNHCRRVLRFALDSGEADLLGLERGFITAVPYGGVAPKRSRHPFPDEVAQAVVDETNLRRLGEAHDPQDRGLRDMWETIVATGRRASEVIELKLECLDRYNKLPMLWHDQTKVGNYDEAIRIPEPVYVMLQGRQRKTRAWFAERHSGRYPTATERAALALFPSPVCNPEGQTPLSYTWFNSKFRQWIQDLELGKYVAHQARHILATRLLRHGATLSHIRRYLGQVSDRMAEHYAKVAVSEIEDVLQHIWVAGPGAPNPGALLSGPIAPLDRHQAEALALDLSRRSTPALGGFCTLQPVVDGGACPFNLDCENCDKFVMSGADLLYWRRKREHWGSVAERAPDDRTADYLHELFAPTAKAIDGLERALAGLGLLEDALALDLRRPQDYFERLWNIGFKATDLAAAADDTAEHDDEGDAEERQSA